MNTQGESSSTSSNFSYDVFISFRGEDTRKNFTGHLYFRLCQVGVNTFIDDEEMRKGDVISNKLDKAIEQSRVAIVVLSKNYASSSWCLDELVKILDCRAKLKQVVLPIFYDVDPSQVRKQTGSFGEALAKHKERLFGAERMEKWKAALTEAANLSGWDLRNIADGHESKFIGSIIKQVLQEVNQRPLDVAHYPIGLDSSIQHIELLLQSECEHEVHMVGICGVGGIGKTTLVKAIYNRIFRQFGGCCFLSDVRSKGKEHGLVKLQEKLLCQILKTKEFEVDGVAEGVNLIKARLGSKKVLIVLDDVDHRSQLESLTRERSWFGSGSVIIITTRDDHLLYGLTTMRDMGREIVRMESPRDSGKRSRLFNPQEVHDVLQGNKGSENIEVLVLERHALKGVKLSTKAFQKMIKLRVLKIDDLHISGDFELLSKELRWLSWKGCPLKCIPSNFLAEKLVILNMKGSNIEEFGLNLQYCRSLKELNLSDCKRLRSTPNFRGSRSLETLSLENCSSLKEIHPSIGNLERLTDLQLNGCKKISDLPSSICQLKSLKYLDISYCSSLQTLPVDIGDMHSLRHIYARDTGIKQLPESVEMLRNLEELLVGGRNLEAKRSFSRRRVRHIESLSIFIFHLSLPYFGLSEDDIPRDIGRLSNLHYLDLSGNSFLHLPFDFSKLPLLMYLYLNDWLDNLPSIDKMDMINCTRLQNPLNEGFFSAPALSIPSREHQRYERLQVYVESNEIPDWCSNKVTAPSMRLTMPTVDNNEYNFLGMVVWFVCHCNVLTLHQYFDVTVSHIMSSAFPFSLDFDIAEPDSQGEISCVYYFSYSNDTLPFKGLNIKGREQITVEEGTDEGTVMKIGIHLLYLDQHGNVTSLPGVLDHSYTPSYPQRLSAGHINPNNNNSEIPQVRSGAGDINSSMIKEQSSEGVFDRYQGKCVRWKINGFLTCFH
ncbi:hypothetical protein MTR67_041728 [Solanum verrucosum]|uniref:TIR domain-containing protein n=1 Tax=Solanum verrucosum TaxID=315347 RepID=A0AAF0UMW1_SOLVR|nr:hypothetical protein MTR67_041728 [Solanum verrucosum]